MMRFFDCAASPDRPDCPCSAKGKRSLANLKTGETGIVRCLDSTKGCHVGKLAAMGITPGTEIEMLSSSGGTVMVLVRSGKLCLCSNLAQAIIIE